MLNVAELLEISDKEKRKHQVLVKKLKKTKPKNLDANVHKLHEEAFEEINCPILFISGRRDKMAPAKLAQKEAAENESASITLIPNCGHNIMSESPDGVLQELKQNILKH